MPRNVILHNEPVFVELVFAGSVLRHELELAAIWALEACERAATSRLLCDCTELAGGHSVGELYFVAERLSSLPMAVAAREAVVLPALPVVRPHAQLLGNDPEQPRHAGAGIPRPAVGAGLADAGGLRASGVQAERAEGRPAVELAHAALEVVHVDGGGQIGIVASAGEGFTGLEQPVQEAGDQVHGETRGNLAPCQSL